MVHVDLPKMKKLIILRKIDTFKKAKQQRAADEKLNLESTASCKSTKVSELFLSLFFKLFNKTGEKQFEVLVSGIGR